MSKPVVLITGALTGIGQAVAELYAADNAIVVVTGRHPDKGDDLVSRLRKIGAADALFIKLDVRHDDEIKAAVDQIIAKYGRLDIAVNNAGRPALGSIVDVTAESYADVYDTNVLGTLLSMKHEFRVMKSQGKGSIVNISSIYGCAGFPHA